MNKLQALKCIEVTSQTQADNGNICYHDPIANCDYILYENGYVRRSLPRVRNYYGRLDTTHAIYQLNPTRTEKHVSEWSGNIFDNKIRIMLPTHEERMECAARGVVNYRNTLKKRYRVKLMRGAINNIKQLINNLEDEHGQYNLSKLDNTLTEIKTLVK